MAEPTFFNFMRDAPSYVGDKSVGEIYDDTRNFYFPSSLPKPPPKVTPPVQTGALPKIKVKNDGPSLSDYHEATEFAATNAGVDPDLYKRLITRESGYDPKAKSVKGAIGLAQFMPKTWNSDVQRMYPGADINNPAHQLAAGASFLKGLHSQFEKEGYSGNDAWWLAAASYNAGGGNWKLKALARARKATGKKLPSIEEISQHLPHEENKKSISYANAIVPRMTKEQRELGLSDITPNQVANELAQGTNEAVKMMGHILDKVSNPFGKWVQSLGSDNLKALEAGQDTEVKAETRKGILESTGPGTFDLEFNNKVSPRTVFFKSVRAVPSSSISIGGGAILNHMMVKTLQKMGVKMTAGKVAATGGAAFGFAEGAVEGGFTSMQVAETILAADPRTLSKSPMYQSYIQQGMDPDQARIQLADTLSSEAGFKSGTVAAALGAPMGMFFGKLLGGAGDGNILSKVVKGAAGEGLQEAAQSGASEYISAKTEQEAGLETQPTKRALMGAAEGAVVGPVMGGGTSVVFDTAGKSKPTTQTSVIDVDSNTKAKIIPKVTPAVPLVPPIVTKTDGGYKVVAEQMPTPGTPTDGKQPAPVERFFKTRKLADKFAEQMAIPESLPTGEQPAKLIESPGIIKKDKGVYNVIDVLPGDVTVEYEFKRKKDARRMSADIKAKAPLETSGDPEVRPADKPKSFRQKLARDTMRALDPLTLGVFKNPLKGIEAEREYKVERYLTLGKIEETGEIATEIYDALGRANKKEAKQVYEYLTNRDYDPKTIKNETIRHAAQKAKAKIMSQSEEMVAKGILTRETVDEHKGEYLPKTYLKHILAGSTGIAGGSRVSGQGYLKKRKDIPEDIKKIVLGEIKDPAYLASRGIGIPGRDLALLDLLGKVANNPDWVMPESVVEWDGKKVSAIWMGHEAARLREQAQYQEDPEVQRETLARARAMDEVSKPALNQENIKEYKQVPDTPRYGNLRGMHVKEQIFDDIVGQSGRANHASKAEEWMGTDGKLSRGTQLWKMSKVALNPPSQIRNFVSNAVLLNLSGVSLTMVPTRLIQAFNEIRSGGKHWKIAQKYGVKMTTFANQEMYRINEDFLKIQAKGGGPFAKIKALGASIAGKASDVYGWSESLYKTAKIIDDMKKGETEQQASLNAHEALFDYSLVPPSIRYLRNAPVGVPFATFYYKAFPFLVKTAVEHPERYIPYMMLPIAFAALFQEMYDVDEEDLEALKEALPEWLHNKGNVYILPYKDKHGRWQAADIGYYFPWSMFQELYEESKSIAGGEGGAGNLLGTTGLLGGPVPDIITALKTNIDPFTQRPIADPSDPPGDQVAAWLQYAWRTAAPTWVTDIGAAAHHYRTLTGAVNPRTGEPLLTGKQVGGRYIGANVYPVDPNASRSTNLRFKKYDIDKVKRKMRKVLGNKNLSREQKVTIRKKYMDYIKQLQTKMAQYSKASRVPPQLR